VRVRHVAVLRHGDLGGQRAPAEGAQIHRNRPVLGGAERTGQAPGALQLHAVALPVVEAERCAAESGGAHPGERDRAVEAATQQHHGGTAASVGQGWLGGVHGVGGRRGAA